MDAHQRRFGWIAEVQIVELNPVGADKPALRLQ
jgi:hypothetical protein